MSKQEMSSLKAPKNKISHKTFKTRPTILQVIPALGTGGVELEALEIGKAIAQAGGRSLIAARIGSWAKEELPAEIEFLDLPLDTKNPIKMTRNSALLKKLMKKEKVDIVHVRSRGPAWSAYKAALKLGIPYITTYHAAYKSGSVLKRFYNSVMAKGDRVIAISPFMVNHITKSYKGSGWFDPSKIRLINRGIDCHYFDPSSVTPQRLEHLLKSWGIESGERVILLPGRISRNKGQDTLINALALMKHADAVVVFLGSASGHESMRDALLKQAAGLDLEGRVKWMPPSPDLPAAYLAADVIVCPSLVPEGFGRVIAEAFAMKKPIVASNIGAPKDTIQEGKTGWLTPPGDAAALAQALDHVLDLTDNQLKKLGDLGRKEALAQYSKETMCSETIALYQEVLSLIKE